MEPLKFKHSTAEASTGFLFWQASSLWQRAIVKALTPYDLTHTQFVLLAGTGWLSKASATPISQVTLATLVKTDIMMTSKVVRALVEKNLLSRVDHPTDSRAYSLRLTDHGAAHLQVALQAVEEVDEQFFAALEASETFRTELLSLIQFNTKE